MQDESTVKIGRDGEDKASKYLESLGYKQQDEVLAYAEGYVLARAGKLTLSEVF